MPLILITSYVNPDLDGVACASAYAEYLQKTGRDAIAGIIGEPHDELKYVFNRFNFSYPETITDTAKFNKFILVDVSDLNGLDENIPPEKVIEIIDHRKIHEADKFPNAKVQIELVGSASTLIAEKFMQANLEISEKSAILLYSAIISNTLNFKGGTTTSRDTDAFNWLKRFTKLPDNFWLELFTAKSDLSGIKLSKQIEGDTAQFTFGHKKLSIAQIEMIGALNLIKERKEEILKILSKLKLDNNLDIIYLSIIDLKDGFNLFVADDEATQNILKNITGVEFKNNVAICRSIIMRKEITPLLKAYLEK